MTSRLVLASASLSRRRLLLNAGVSFEVDPAHIDEHAIRSVLERDRETKPGDVAELLARAKAETVSQRNPGVSIIGADQVLALGNQIFEKPRDMSDARDTLLALQGRTHALYTAVCVVRDEEVVWSTYASAFLTMRSLTPQAVGHYLARAGSDVGQSVGAYQLEGIGIQLFEYIDGDYFSIVGLPLLPLINFLRSEQEILS